MSKKQRAKRVAEPVNIYEAKSHLSELVERAFGGEEIIIAKAGTPKARLVPLAPVTARRPLGLFAGEVWIADDFDAPLPPDVLAAFYGGGPPRPVPRRKRP